MGWTMSRVPWIDKAKEYLDIAGEIKDDEGSFLFLLPEINRIVDYVSLYHQSGDIKAAYEEVQKILSLPEKAFEEPKIMF